MNVFVSGASGVVGYGVLKSLESMGHNLYSSTIYAYSAAQKFSNHFVQAIPTNDPHYLDWLIEVFNNYKIDIAFPGIDADVYFWNQHRDMLEESGVKLVLNNPNLIELCRDKWSFYQFLLDSSASCSIESTLDKDYERLEKKFGIPFLLKPREGFGSKGIVKVNSEQEYYPFQSMLGSELMAQEFIGSDNEEYTIAAFGDGQGQFSNMFSMKRTLAKEGYTQTAIVIDNERFIPVITELSRIFKPLGPTNYQFRLKNGHLKLLEINPRISSSSSIRSKFGYNEALMSLSFYLNNIIPDQPITSRGRAVRYVEDLIFEE